jgi:NAD(P)-dependent dehydrogenase (short-subunit alcohol dehydrogenase family)
VVKPAEVPTAKMQEGLKTGTSARPDLPLAVVVGAGGMGIAITRRLGTRYRLLLADLNAERLSQCSAALRDEGYDAQIVVCDITEPDSVANLTEAASRLGPLRVLAHVAGLSPSMADWRTILRVNLCGAARVADAMLPLACEHTVAIFIASLGAHMLPPPSDSVVALVDAPLDCQFLERIEAECGSVSSTLAYQLSKLAIIRMCGRRTAEWGARGARIVSLSPGLIATAMGALEFKRQPVKYELLLKTPLKREGTVLEIAAAVEFLASERASFITGIDLLVDGGVAAALRYGPPDDPANSR